MKLEKANIDSIPLIIQLLKDLYIELGEEEESVVYLNERLVKEILDSQQTEVYLAYDHNHEVAGLVTLTECQSFYAGGKYGLIDEMFIKPGFRSNNIGSQIITDVKHIGKEKGWTRIDVTAPTEERWKRTVAFYERCGFVFTGPKLKLIL